MRVVNLKRIQQRKAYKRYNEEMDNMTQRLILENKEAKATKAVSNKNLLKKMASTAEVSGANALQPHLGNTAIQRLLAQRSGGGGAFDLDNETASRINRSRCNGQPLDGSVQKQMGESMGSDFSGVRVHTGSESHQLNEQLNAKAFTTGSDIFFREGAYSPQSSGGQELIAHELTHVVQQNSGAVGGSGGGMKVNAPGDRFEQEADAVSKSVTSSSAAPSVQRATPMEDEIATKRLQRQELEEEPMVAADSALPEDQMSKAEMPAEQKEELTG